MLFEVRIGNGLVGKFQARNAREAITKAVRETNSMGNAFRKSFRSHIRVEQCVAVVAQPVTEFDIAARIAARKIARANGTYIEPDIEE